MNAIGNYYDLYWQADDLLADVFEKFIYACLEYYGLDPCQYFNSPGLCWDPMLKITEVELELISDTDMDLFLEKWLGGAISYIAERHSQANNKYMKCYDSSKENKFIMHLEVNNL